jgi:hypothetical protein
MIALCTVLCSGQGAGDMALFAKSKEPFLGGILKLRLTSHDTFSRRFRLLDPAQFGALFQRFMALLQGHRGLPGRVFEQTINPLAI